MVGYHFDQGWIIGAVLGLVMLTPKPKTPHFSWCSALSDFWVCWDYPNRELNLSFFLLFDLVCEKDIVQNALDEYF